MSFPGAITECGGDVGVAVEPQEGNGGVSQGGEVLWSAAGANSAGVFPESDVADVMGAIFNLPVSSPTTQQPGRTDQPAWRAGDGVVDFGGPLSLTPGRAC